MKPLKRLKQSLSDRRRAVIIARRVREAYFAALTVSLQCNPPRPGGSQGEVTP